MRLRTLGTLLLDGTSFRRHKPLLLLAYLVLEGPQERSHLSRVFWPEAPQPSQRLRSTLDLLRSGAPGTAVRVGSKIMSPLRCDALELQMALEGGELERCVALYEGAFLEGLAAGRLGLELEEWVFAARERLADYARHALLRLAGRSRGDPRRSAHYAKQAYLLAGADVPSPEQVGQILRALQAVGDPLVATVERSADGAAAPLGEVFDPSGVKVTSKDGIPPHNLEVPPTPLLGRGALLSDLERRLAAAGVRLLSVTGMGGVGKTRLAVELAWRLLPNYGGVHFVSLATCNHPGEVLGAVARALDLEAEVGRPLRDTVIRRLQGLDELLVLDNFEHVLEASSDVADLLARCLRLTVIVTSRSALRLRGEHEIVVPPLPVPPASELDAQSGINDPRDYASVALFCARAAEGGGGSDAALGDLASVAAICRRLDGLPLALELAAGRTKLLSPAEILARLSGSLDLLAQGARDLPERHRSLRGTLAWSYDLLTGDEQRLFRRLGVTVGGCNLALAKALWQGEGEGAKAVDGDVQVLELLGSLLDKSLIVRVKDTDGGLRITLLETVQRFAAETLAADPAELHVSLERMFDHVRGLASELRDSVAGADASAMARVSSELGNIRAAWLWAIMEGRTAYSLQAFMFDFFANTGSPREGILLFSSAAHLLEERKDAEAEGRIYGSLAWFYYITGDIASARDTAEKSVAALRQVGRTEVLGVALETYAGILYGVGDYPGARAAYTEVYGLHQTLDRRAMVLHNLGVVATAVGDYSKALELFERAQAGLQRQGLTWASAETLARIGEVYRLTGDLIASRQASEEGYALSRTASAAYSQMLAAYELGLTALVSDDIARADALLDETLRAARSGMNPELTARAHLGLARTAAVRGEKTHMTEHLLEALLAVKDTGLRPVVLSCLLTVAELGSLLDFGAEVVALLPVVRDHPAARANERHRATALIGEMEADSSVDLEDHARLPPLSEQVVACLTRWRADDSLPEDDPPVGGSVAEASESL